MAFLYMDVTVIRQLIKQQLGIKAQSRDLVLRPIITAVSHQSLPNVPQPVLQWGFRQHLFEEVAFALVICNLYAADLQ